MAVSAFVAHGISWVAKCCRLANGHSVWWGSSNCEESIKWSHQGSTTISSQYYATCYITGSTVWVCEDICVRISCSRSSCRIVIFNNGSRRLVCNGITIWGLDYLPSVFSDSLQSSCIWARDANVLRVSDCCVLLSCNFSGGSIDY